MGKWILQEVDSNLPKWLSANLPGVCECGSKIENYYNDAGNITSRRCSNTVCPYRLAQKVVGVCNILGVKGIGPERALGIVKDYSLKSQYAALPYILKDKPTVSLYDYLRMSFIKGVDTGWASVSNKCETLEECFTKYKGEYSKLLEENKEMLYDGLQYVTFRDKPKKVYKPAIVGTVMISGTLRGYKDRNAFIAALNMVFKGLVSLSVSESKRKTGIMALIQEADAPNRGKAECALQNGIPIMTPKEFQRYIMERVSEIMRNKQAVKYEEETES